ncbi:hypothetical protein ACGFZG_03635 [Streptomyces antibioticus]|uniref:hypothetical protein n=1 Tax=Streptomyces antibioticus TaxID=1890 RepID=UPI003724299E
MSRQPQQQTKGSKIAGIGCLSVVALLVLVVVISLATDEEPTSNKASSSAGNGLTEEQIADIRESVGLPPTPNAADWAAYIDDLNAISRDIVHGKEEKAVSRGINQCSSIKSGFDRPKLIDLTNRRFTSPDHPEGHGTGIAAQILDVVHERICPDF